MWESAVLLHGCAAEYKLNIHENCNRELKTDYTREECIAMTEYKIPSGYSCHSSGDYLREKYHNGFGLREKVFADICCCTKLDRYTMEKY